MLKFFPKGTLPMPYLLFVLALIAVDQLTKVLVRANIPLGASVPFLPGVMELTYVQNTGAAFSFLSQHTWLLTAVSLAASLLLAAALWKKWLVRGPLGRTMMAMVLAGAVGNLIDRALFGFVTDMFATTFINFAVFNVADICVVVGGIGFVLYYGFLFDRFEKEKDHGASDADR